MSYSTHVRIVFLALTLGFMPAAMADEDPRHERHELMEDVGKAAKPVGKMLKGEIDFDVDVLMASLQTWQDVSMVFGDLFPVGSETGNDTEAAPAIWDDRAGFEEALANFREATAAALAASPTTLDDAKPVVDPIFKTCKGCHDTYRIEEE